MYIYKITNLLNNKIYIGQVYNKSIYDRFRRHISEAKPTSKSYIGRAIAKYGFENFTIKEIDTANTLEELNEKEKYWIKYYNSTDLNYGYNLTPGGDGGNTYLCKSNDEMREIKKKLSDANSGSNNGMAKGFKCRNEKTGKEYHFPTVAEGLKFFNMKNKGFISSRCNKQNLWLYKDMWNFAWEGEEYADMKIYDPSIEKGNPIKIKDIITGEEKTFASVKKLYAYLGCSKLPLERIQKLYKDKYIIEKF